jgi:hypothetical protein
MSEAAERRAAIVSEVSAALQDADCRSPVLINYWWETTGWVKPDWDRIADLAVAVTMDHIARRDDTPTSAS